MPALWERMCDLCCRKVVLLVLAWGIFAPAFAQKNTGVADQSVFHGLPPVIHYSKKDFKGESQFWAMCQDKEGVLYFANNDGALIFDGQQWHKVLLPNKSSIRSLMVSNDNTVYAGGFNELGTIRKDAYGKYYYESLMHLLRAEERNIENVWQIHEVNQHIVFRTFKRLIAIEKDKAMTFPSSSDFLQAGVVNNRYYAHDREGVKALDLNSMSFEMVLPISNFKGEDLVGIVQGFDGVSLLVITKQGSFFEVDPLTKTATLSQRFFPPGTNNLLTSALKTSWGDYYIGTLRTKIVVLSAEGTTIVQAQAFSSLQDNTVHNLFESREGKIWALLNNGVDCIDVKSPVSLVLGEASFYDVAVTSDRLFAATNQGVFVASHSAASTLTKESFSNLAGLEGQAWSLAQAEGKILCAHDRGLFEIDGAKVRKIPGVHGVWKLIKVDGKPHHYLACTYDGIYLVTHSGTEGFRVHHKVEGFTESSRDILQADQPGVFWVCHGYKGVFRIKIDEAFKRVVSLEHFKDKNGLPSAFNNNVARWNNEIIFTTNAGVYVYDEKKNQFVEHRFLTSLFGKELNVRKFFQMEDKAWFAHDDEVGYFSSRENNPSLRKDLFLQLKGTLNPSMECIVPVGDDHVLVGTNNGLYAFDLDFKVPENEIPTVITSVSYEEAAYGNKINLALDPSDKPRIAQKSNNISFQFTTPGFHNKTNAQFSYWLEDVDQWWSPWTEVARKEYSSLRPGLYVFKVRSRSLLGERGSEASYEFVILPAWYQTPLAILGFALFGCAVVVTGFVSVKKRIRYERHKTLAEEQDKRRVLELEIERFRLASEKEEILKDKELLEEDVIHKSKELVNYTTLLAKKRELLSELFEQLKTLKDLAKNDPARQAITDLLKKIKLNLESDEYIRVFEANFERVHQEFFNQLKANFSDLTPKELQLCAFVRMNLTNKEIAAILNLSVRGIETARYRLRKRLGMSQEQDMSQFLEKLHAHSDSSGAEMHSMAL